jgi:carboxypeptidase family protein
LQTNFIKILFVFCVGIFSTLYAQTATVSGRVVDENNNPIQDVSVVTADGHVAPVFTDADGKYQITIPANKEVELDFINLSYKISNAKITAKPNEKITLNPRLVFKNAIEDVTVIGENRKQDMV